MCICRMRSNYGAIAAFDVVIEVILLRREVTQADSRVKFRRKVMKLNYSSVVSTVNMTSEDNRNAGEGQVYEEEGLIREEERR